METRAKAERVRKCKAFQLWKKIEADRAKDGGAVDGLVNESPPGDRPFFDDDANDANDAAKRLNRNKEDSGKQFDIDDVDVYGLLDDLEKKRVLKMSEKDREIYLYQKFQEFSADHEMKKASMHASRWVLNWKKYLYIIKVLTFLHDMHKKSTGP